MTNAREDTGVAGLRTGSGTQGRLLGRVLDSSADVIRQKYANVLPVVHAVCGAGREREGQKAALPRAASIWSLGWDGQNRRCKEKSAEKEEENSVRRKNIAWPPA